MRKFNLNGCSFKPIELKVLKKPLVQKRYNRALCYCICIETKDGFKAFVNIKNSSDISDTAELNFTEESYNLKGKTKVFTINKDKKGKSICVIRNPIKASVFPGLPTQYTPFKHKYVYKGNLVKVNGTLCFDVVDILENMSYCNNLVRNIKIPNYEK